MDGEGRANDISQRTILEILAKRYHRRHLWKANICECFVLN